MKIILKRERTSGINLINEVKYENQPKLKQEKMTCKKQK